MESSWIPVPRKADLIVTLLVLVSLSGLPRAFASGPPARSLAPSPTNPAQTYRQRRSLRSIRTPAKPEPYSLALEENLLC